MKALEKDRDRRYHSASEFADDLQRFLDQEPVLASPPSVPYKVSKFIRRNRAAVTGIGVLASLLLVLAGVSVLWQFDRINTRRILAEKRATELELNRNQRQQAIRDAEQRLTNETIPAITQLVESGDHLAALEMLKPTTREFPDDERLKQLLAA